MNITVYQPSKFAKTFEALKDIEDAKIVFSPEGITVHSYDSAHIYVVYMRIKNTPEKFNFICPETVRVAVNIPLLTKILKNIDNESTLNIIVDEENRDSPECLKIIGTNKNGGINKYEIRTRDISDNTNPELDEKNYFIDIEKCYQKIISFKADDFRSYCNELCALSSDHITISINEKNEVMFEVKSDMCKASRLVVADMCHPGNIISYNISSNERLSHTFLVKHINTVAKTCAATRIGIYLTNNKSIPTTFCHDDEGYSTKIFFGLPCILDDDDGGYENNALVEQKMDLV